MRLALNALTEELRRLKAGGGGRVSVSDGAIEALRRSAAAQPAAARAPAQEEAPASAPAPAAPRAPAPRPAASEPTVPPPVVVLPEGDKQVRWDALRDMVLAD